MSKGRAFFSTIPGIISALAGLVTVIVGVLAISAQLGGDGDDNNGGNGSSSGTTVSTLAGGRGGTTGAGGGGSATTAAPARLSVAPTTITFKFLETKKVVKVTNDGTGPVSLETPQMAGPDRARFNAVGCSGSLAAGRSCDIEITFAPTRQGHYTAQLEVTPAGGTAIRVPVEGDHLL